MQSTMQDFPLSIASLFEHGRKVHGRSEVVTFDGAGCRRALFSDVADRASRLATALRRLGVGKGDVVGTLCFTTQQHLEAYFAIPCMGAVLHTLNLRLSPEQLVYVLRHAQDKVVLVDPPLVPLVAKVAPAVPSVKAWIVVGDAPDLPGAIAYEGLVASGPAHADWPEVDERSAAVMCYTSGTTGNPKGVVYSHRSIFLHTMAVCAGAAFGVTERDRILPIAPMFHANAWGLPHAGWAAGADFVFPGRFLQAEPLCRLIAAERPTIAGAVPAIWKDILRHAETATVDLSSLRTVICGGSAVPRSLMEEIQQRFGVRLLQAWGMTETSPLGAIALPPKDGAPGDEMTWRAMSGRIVPGVEARIVGEDGKSLPWDGKSVGEIEVRGPWITASYHGGEDPEKFHDGWLRTGDVGTLDDRGFLQLTDRAKDVIKTGGEWISSVDLEGTLMAHPDVFEAAVIGIPDARWDERPLACIVLKPGATATAATLRAFVATRHPRFWMPERWAFITEVPKTAVGKFDKKVLRARFKEGQLAVETATE